MSHKRSRAAEIAQDTVQMPRRRAVATALARIPVRVKISSKPRCGAPSLPAGRTTFRDFSPARIAQTIFEIAVNDTTLVAARKLARMEVPAE